MKKASLILFTALALAFSLRAGSLDSASVDKIKALASARKLGSADIQKLVDESKAAYAAGGSAREILALLEAAPIADASQLVKTLADMKDMLSEGLLDREARKVALKGLELRLKSPSTVTGKSVDASEALRLKRADSLADRDRVRRQEIRDRAGRTGQDGDLARPTPTQH